MLQCWSYSADDRPSFKSICEFLTALNNEASPYVEFDPKHILPPEGYCKIDVTSRAAQSTATAKMNPSTTVIL